MVERDIWQHRCQPSFADARTDQSHRACALATDAPRPRPVPLLPRRRLAQAAFTPKAVRGYLPRMQASAEEAARMWAEQRDIQ